MRHATRGPSTGPLPSRPTIPTGPLPMPSSDEARR